MGFKESINKGSLILSAVEETLKELYPTVEVIEIKPTEIPIIEDNRVLTTEEILQEVPKIVIEKKAKKKIVKKQREDTKVVIDCGLKGTTIEAREFRAIVKKKGLQINVVLNGIIAEWNQTNYNL